MYTKEQILKQINELVLTRVKADSNIKETIGGLAANDNVLNSVMDDLLPFRNNGQSLLVGLGMKITDGPEQQTVNNIMNFYTMVRRDDSLQFVYAMRWDSEPYELSLQDIISAGFEL